MLNSRAAAPLFVPGCRLAVPHTHTQRALEGQRKDWESTVLTLLDHVALHCASVTIKYFNHQLISAAKPQTPLLWQVHPVQGLSSSVRTLLFISTSMERCILVPVWTLQATCTSFFRHWGMRVWLIRPLFPSWTFIIGLLLQQKVFTGNSEEKKSV